jgi:hypothetical protein
MSLPTVLLNKIEKLTYISSKFLRCDKEYLSFGR